MSVEEVGPEKEVRQGRGVPDADGCGPPPDEQGGSSESLDSLYEDDSDASYIYKSEESNGFSSEADTEEERDYFGEDVAGDSSTASEVAWCDSDENDELRMDYQDTAPWLFTEGLTKRIKARADKVVFRLNKKVFRVKYKVKLIRVFEEFTLVVDTFDIVYLLRNFQDYRSYKLEYFRISDAVLFGGDLLLSSPTCPLIKRLSMDGKVTEMRKCTGPVRRMVVWGDLLFVLGEKVCCFNTRLVLRYVLRGSYVDMCVNGAGVVLLAPHGDVLALDHKLNLKKKYTFPNRFQFRSIHCTEKNYFVGTEDGFTVLDPDFEVAREFSNLKSAPTCFSHNEDFVVYGAGHQNSLRIVKEGLQAHDKFPFSKVRIDPLSSLCFSGDVLLMGHSCYVSSLKINYLKR